MEEEMIQLTYHLKDKYITASKKDFFKPEESYRKQSEIMTPEMCITYQVWRKSTWIEELFWAMGTQRVGAVSVEVWHGIFVLSLSPICSSGSVCGH